MGVQSFNKNEFEMLGRGHSFDEIQKSIEILKKSRIEDNKVSIDLMQGIPLQTISSFNKSLDRLIDLNFGHCSLYMLQLEKKTPFYKMYKSNDLLPDDDEIAEMYELMQTRLSDAGLNQYEVSNFAREGFESKHNQMYWDGQQEFMAFGMGAASFTESIRFERPKSLKKYFEFVENWRPIRDN